MPSKLEYKFVNFQKLDQCSIICSNSNAGFEMLTRLKFCSIYELGNWIWFKQQINNTSSTELSLHHLSSLLFFTILTSQRGVSKYESMNHLHFDSNLNIQLQVKNSSWNAKVWSNLIDLSKHISVWIFPPNRAKDGALSKRDQLSGLSWAVWKFKLSEPKLCCSKQLFQTGLWGLRNCTI